MYTSRNIFQHRLVRLVTAREITAKLYSVETVVTLNMAPLMYTSNLSYFEAKVRATDVTDPQKLLTR